MSDQDASRPSLPGHLRQVTPLGVGAFGRVYRALSPTDEVLAVKVLADEHLARPEAAWQFQGEYRWLARLAHPGFPRAVEEGLTASGAPYYAMTLAPGEPPLGPLPAAAVEAILAGAAEALAYLHGLGLVHGDLKPDNLRLTPEGRVVLLDVGLMAPVGQRREAISGTLEYLAPEAFRKAPVDPASDLYALGCLAYELWTGSPPFVSEPGQPMAIVRAHLSEPPPPLEGRTPDPDMGLEFLIGRLLAKDPADRPASARAVVAILAGEPEDEPTADQAARLRGSTFVGRSDVRAAWRALLDGPRHGLLLLTGESGMGKSVTLDALRLDAALAGRPFVGAAATGPAAAPAAPMRTLTAQALGLAGLQPTENAAAWLSGTLPEALNELEPASRKVLLQAEAAQALAEAAERLGGLAIGLDDWHLADGASRDFLTFLRQSHPEAPLAFALATAPDATAPWPEALAFALPPFSLDEAESLVAARLGALPPDGLVAPLMAVAGGQPLLLDLGLEQMVASGQLVHTAGGWRLGDSGRGAAALPASLAAAWEARYAHLGPEARLLAAVAALAAPAGDLAVPVLAAVAGLSADGLEEALEALAAEGLLAVQDGLARLAHAGAGPMFLAALTPVLRARWSTQLAEACLAGASLTAVPLDRLVGAAWLALAGDDPGLASRTAGEAGRRSLALFAPKAALALLSAAREHLAPHAPDEERLALVLPLAEAQRYGDRLDEALGTYQTAQALALSLDDGAARAQALIGLGKCRQMRADYPGALEALREAEAAAAAVGDRFQQARAAVSEARVLAFQGEGAQALARCEDAATIARMAGAEAVLAQALNLGGYLRVQQDPAAAPMGLDDLREALAIAERLGDRVGMGLAYDNMGNTHLALGDLLAAQRVFALSERTSREAGLVTENLAARLNQAIVAAERGEVEVGATLGAEVVRRAESVGRKFLMAAAMTAEAQSAWRAGRVAAALDRLEAALDIALSIQNRMLEEHVRAYRLEAWLATGSLEAARSELAIVAAIVEATGHAEMEARLACHRGELARQAGDAEGALAAVAPWRDAPNRIAAHQAALIAAAAHMALAQPEQALQAAQAALRIARDWDAPWHIATDAALAARAATACGEPESALAYMQEALDQPGASPYALAAVAAQYRSLGRSDGADAEREAWTALNAGMAAFDPAQKAALLAAQNLTRPAATSAPSPGPAPAGLALDPAAYGRWIEALALERDEAGIGRVALQAVLALTGADRGYLLSYEGGRLRKAITQAIDYAAEAEGGFSQSIVEAVLYSGQPLYVADASGDTQWGAAASVMALSLKTVIGLPVATPDAILGVLYVDREALEPLLGPADMSLLAALATTAASAIFRERARHDQEAAYRLMTAVSQGLGAQLSPEALRTEILRTAVTVTEAEHGFWLTPDTAEGAWQAVASVDGTGRPLAFQPAMISRGVTDYVATHQESLSILDMSDSEGWQERMSVQALGLRTVWCVPVGTPDEALLYLDTRELAQADPTAALKTLEALIAAVRPLLDFLA